MAKVFRVIITERDTCTNETTEHIDEEFSGISLLADRTDGVSMAEINLHDSIANLALKISNSNNFKKAAMLMTMADTVMSMRHSCLEDKLSNSIEGKPQ